MTLLRFAKAAIPATILALTAQAPVAADPATPNAAPVASEAPDHRLAPLAQGEGRATATKPP